MQYDFRWPAFDAAFAAAAIRMIMLALIAGVALWGMHELAQRLKLRPRDGAAAAEPGS
jgi:hypothetical protein